MNSRYRLYYLVGLLVIIGTCYYLFFSPKAINKEVKYIAMVGKFTDFEHPEKEPSDFNLAIQKGLEYYLKQKSKEYPDFDLKLKVFDNQQLGSKSKEFYTTDIAQDSSIIAVVDFTFGSHFKEAASAIKANNIPVITINPDHNNLDFGNNVLFVYNDDEMARDLSAFVQNINIDSIDFISEEDYPQHESFLAQLKKRNIVISDTLTFRAENMKSPEDYSSIINQIENRYRNLDSTKIKNIIMSSHSVYGDSILSYIDANFNNIRIIGPVFITTFGEGSGFGKNTNNEIIVIDKPMDALSKKLTKDLHKLRKKYPDKFDVDKAPLFVKRSYDAVSLIDMAIKSQPDSIKITRRIMKDFINSCPGQTLIDKEDIYHFDKNNSLIKDLTFTTLKNDKVNSYKRQMNSKRKTVPNLFFGMEVQDIFDMDVSSNSFSADFYYWVKMDTADAGTENYISFQNMKQSESTIELVIEEQADDVLYKLYRVSGKFFVEYQLAEFPMDAQEIDIIIEILRPVDEVKISFDKSSFELDPTLLDRFKVPGWKKTGYFITVNNHITKSLRGDPKHTSGEFNKFKTLSFSLDVERNFLSGFLEIILPLAMISFISIGLLYTKDLSFSTMGEVSVGTFLGIIAFSISLSDMTPSSNYLTKADLLFWLSFGINFTSFMVIIVLNSIYKEKRLRSYRIPKLRTALMIGYPIAVVIILLL